MTVPLTRGTIRGLLVPGATLSLPGAHDALSARLIEQAGFAGVFIGGFTVAGVRFGLPDIGLAQLGEFSGAVRDIANACSLPILMDADNGYGDVKNAVHVMHTYERMGVTGLFMEDQMLPKRCGHMAGKQLVPVEEMERKIRALAGSRLNPATFLIARTDARAVDGMDAALRRAERYVRAGAEGVFIESMLDREEMARAAREVDAVHVANMVEGGLTPILTPAELAGIGYGIALYGISLMLRATRAMQLALADFKNGEFKLVGSGTPFAEFTRIVGIDEWAEVENRFGAAPSKLGHHD
jgi:2-methylisocitrate lyase-like PEP mutase family enzyme